MQTTNQNETDRARAGACPESSGSSSPAAPAGKEMAMPLQIYGFAWIGRGCWQVTLLEKVDGKMKPVEEVKLFRRMQDARDFCAADPAFGPKASPCCGFIGKALPGERFGYEWRQCGCGHIYIVRQPAKSS